MAVSSYILIVFEHERPEVRRAGLLYIVVTHTSMLALCALFAVWGNGARDLTFAALAEHAPALPAGGLAVLLLALVGFGLKAGLVPFHIWLPEAHAAAPSHISAFMSGVVIKMGIYGVMRVVVLMATPPAWWGWVVLGLGMVSAVLGVIWALAQHDLKRLLAFHSVENIGIILIGLGAGILGAAYGHPVIAALGFAGAVLHTVNHALFKSLLFLGAGSVIHATGTRNLDHLGGVARRMPATAALFLVGSIAIVGLPPLNGFVSEWVVFRALLQGGLSADASRFAIVGGAALALAGALALACFAKVIGIVYLGTARHDAPGRAAHESPAGMTVPMTVLASACICIGLLPMFVLPALLRIGTIFASGPARVAADAAASALIGDPAPTVVTLFALSLGLGLVVAIVAYSVVGRTSSRPTSLAPTWGGGFPRPTARMQYTASSFAAPLTVAFRSVAGVRRSSAPGFVTHGVDPILAGIVLPVWRGLRTAAGRLRPIQHGRVAFYLLYIAAALTLLLLYLVFAGPGTP
jgi:formate hydrogenlyase subunit 3/multisubunit Na+/H+ antiporter MnhD subunit